MNGESTKILVDEAETSLIFYHRSAQLHPMAINDGSSLNIYQLNFADNSVQLLSQVNGGAFLSNAFFTDIAVSSDFSTAALINLDPIGSSVFNFRTRAYVLDVASISYSNLVAPRVLPSTLNANILTARMSDDQNQIYFVTRAANVLPDITPGPGNLFHYNRLTGVTKLISENYSAFNSFSDDFDALDVSPNGRYAAYSVSDPLGVTLYDSQTGEFFLVNDSRSVKPKVNDDGNVVYRIHGTGSVKLWDKQTQTLQSVIFNTDGDESTGSLPDIAGSGLSTWITFESFASDLIANDNNGRADIFMLNWPDGDIFRISQINGIGGTDSSREPVISSDTTSVVFQTSADELVKYDRVSNTLSNVCKTSAMNECDVDFSIERYYGISPGGRYVSFSPEFGENYSVYLYDSLNDTTSIVTTQLSRRDDNRFFGIGIDESFIEPKLGVLFTENNLLLDDLYGIDNIGGFNGNGFTSAFLYQQGGDGETLNLEIKGVGQVFGGLNCTSDCEFTFALGTELTLSIIEPPGQIFVGWEGECINQDSVLDFECDVIMDFPKTIKAKFIDENDRIFVNGFEN